MTDVQTMEWAKRGEKELVGADLMGTDLRQENLTGVNLTNANLRGQL